MTDAVCWVDAEPRPGWWQMARDAAMLDLARTTGALLIRLYAWAPHCLSFGSHEPASHRYDRARIEQLGLDCVRRPTGGRAVWHARELTYAVAAPERHLGSLTDAYRAIHEWMAGALARLGADPSLAPRRATPGVDAGPCFSVAMGGEVLVRGRKIVGSAQLRRDGALLQHGSMLLEDDQALVRSLLTGDGGPDGAAPEAPLALVLGRPVSFEEAAGAVGAELVARQLPSFEPQGPAALDRLAARFEPQFRSPAWTWRR